ncbi:DDE-type integrase/transposase/recombinase, partial [Vibrio sagamiensis]|uniref:DDE-type integrase/transposase/recombinase n=1 Tax=Vibrio sagamiensis TaxID=512650 RepID=UPI0011AFC3A8
TIYRWFIHYGPILHKKLRRYQFLKRCLRRYKTSFHSNALNTDKHSSYGNAIDRLKREGRLRQDVEHRQVKYLNNGIESDHALIKKLIEATGGFKVRKRACSTIQSFEGIRMLNKGQFDFWLRRDEPKLRVQERSAFLNELFNIFGIYA